MLDFKSIASDVSLIVIGSVLAPPLSNDKLNVSVPSVVISLDILSITDAVLSMTVNVPSKLSRPVKSSDVIPSPLIVYGTTLPSLNPCVFKVIVTWSPSLTNRTSGINSNVWTDVSLISTLTVSPISSSVRVNISTFS